MDLPRDARAWPVDRPVAWVGRQEETAVLDTAVDALTRGEGTVLWVEGEPGIGKSALIAAGADTAREAGYDVLWGMADQLSQRFPLRAICDCLQVRTNSPDPRRAEIATFLRDRRPGLLAGDEIVYAAAEMLVSLVDELCTASPTVIVLDDLHWTDEASLMVWHRLTLAAEQLPLLLIGASRPGPRQQELQKIRASVRRRGGTVLTLGALDDTEVDALITSMIEAPGQEVSQLAAQAMGNPLYLRELVDAMNRGMIAGVPASFAAALGDRLSLVPEATVEVLRAAAMLGGRFSVSHLAVVLDRPVSELTSGLQDAMAAGILTGADSYLAFRHPLIRQALYDTTPAALRSALHLEAAQALLAAGVEPMGVAQQLLAAEEPGGGWARGWLVEAAPVLAARAPDIAAELLQRELDQVVSHDDEGQTLAIELARVLLGMGRHEEAATRARQALTVTADPDGRAELYWVLARALFSAGHNDEGVTTVERALGQPDVPGAWRARLLAALAMFQRAVVGDLDAADATAHQALKVGEQAGDTFAASYALSHLWLSHSVQRDHLGALSYLDRALTVLSDGPDHANLRSFVFDARIFTLQNLARWPEAEETLHEAQELAHLNDPGRATSSLSAAVLLYWLGSWDDALAELSSVEQDVSTVTYAGRLDRGPLLIWRGAASLIAGRRNDRATAAEQLQAGLAIPVLTVSDQENLDFLLAAQALAAEQDGDPQQAVSILSAVLQRRPGEMTLTHQWLPELVRLALSVDDHATAGAALEACQAEAAVETQPARAAAASNRCRGLFHGDPAPLREAVAHYQELGPKVDLASALEDLAVVLAGKGENAEARDVLDQAMCLYGCVNAAWDIHRAERRLRALGVRRGVRGPRVQRAAHGWGSLTPTELKVAGLVVEGNSTPSIAKDMYLSRRTVQTHISRIITKLGVRSRVEIARVALSQGSAT
ncbi:AAA family ATPase [Lentzea sp. NPDC051213]|uniref:helix-turn-helix transcriptional regulator n=1 Tax=Lentzea sp. NPDC051213 TaxID=3364126 RepID=UPI00379F8B2B